MGRAVQGLGHSGCASHCQYCRGDQSPYRVDAAPPASAASATGFGASNRATARVGATNTVLSIAPPDAFTFRRLPRRDRLALSRRSHMLRHGIAGHFVPVFFLNMVDRGPGPLFARSRSRICALRRQPRRPRGYHLAAWAAICVVGQRSGQGRRFAMTLTDRGRVWSIVNVDTLDDRALFARLRRATTAPRIARDASPGERLVGARPCSSAGQRLSLGRL